MESLIYITLGISSAAFILAAINLYNINNLAKALDSALDSISNNHSSISSVSDSLLDLRKNFNDKVLEILEELSGRLFKLENPISSTTKFFYKENEVTVVKLSEGGFLLKSSDFKNKKLSEGEFYNLWFKGQLRKKNV
jgi:hypothetical protein